MSKSPIRTPTPRPVSQQPHSRIAARDRRAIEAGEDREEDDPRLVDSRGAEREDDDDFSEFLSPRGILPYIPDTDAWHFFYARSRIGAEPDGDNIQRKLNGPEHYSLVTLDDLAQVPDAPDLRMHVKASIFPDQPWIQVGDMVLMKCPMRRYLLKQRAEQFRADEQREMPTQAARQEFGKRFSQADYEDSEVRRVEGWTGNTKSPFSAPRGGRRGAL